MQLADAADREKCLLLDLEERKRLKRKLYEADFESVESLTPVFSAPVYFKPD